MSAARPHLSSIRAARRAAGFTLIEIMIVVAIVGIVTAIAYPSYTTYVKEARRSDAHLALLEQRQMIERCRATRYRYTDCELTKTASPEDHYTLSLAPAPTANTFRIVATATGIQTNDEDCARLAIDEQDTKLGFKKGGGRNDDECW